MAMMNWSKSLFKIKNKVRKSKENWKDWNHFNFKAMTTLHKFLLWNLYNNQSTTTFQRKQLYKQKSQFSLQKTQTKAMDLWEVLNQASNLMMIFPLKNPKLIQALLSKLNNLSFLNCKLKMVFNLLWEESEIKMLAVIIKLRDLNRWKIWISFKFIHNNNKMKILDFITFKFWNF